ncbi:hypothetical protein CSB37_01100 [bacterium DOLZORAL124_38_8]|nr:MAG: hypothetical protein CSB37_01100 [bacterium DOLZORAL124_38_8]
MNWRKILKFCFWSLFFLFLLGLAVASFVFVKFDGYKYIQLGKTISPKTMPFAIVFEDRNGKEFYRSFGNQNREWVNIESVPETLKIATVMSEDKRFYQHHGIDLWGIARAMATNIKAGRIIQGGSTITQQIAKKAFLSDERTFERKIKEIFLSYGIEQALTKDEILELYLNIAPYGATLSGIKSSADFYFKKSVSDLSDEESLVLSVLPKDPVRLSRQTFLSEWFGSCKKSRKCTIFSSDFEPKRLDSVLLAVAKKQQWSTEKILTTWQAMRGKRLPRKQFWANNDFQHFRFYVVDFLKNHHLNLENFPGGLRVKTTIDTKLQTDLLRYLRSGVLHELTENNGMNNNAVLLLENESRGPLVWIGSRDFWEETIDGQVDLLRSLRQTGSAIKPFVFTAFFERGFGPLTKMWDTRVRFSGDTKIIQNSDGLYQGEIFAGLSLAQSRNVPAAQAFYLAGGEVKVKKYLDNAFGLDIRKNHPQHNFGWSLALGTAPIAIKNLANAYSTLATGVRRELCPIISLQTMTGEPLPSPCSPSTRRFVSEEARFFTLSSLANPMNRPEGPWRDNTTLPGKTVAVKSGTSSKSIYGSLYPVDNYLIGTNPNMTFLLWGGNTNGANMEQGTFGTTALGPHWKKMLQFVFQRYPHLNADFVPPKTVIKVGNFWKRKGKPVKKFQRIPSMSFVKSSLEPSENASEKSGIEQFLESELSKVIHP